MIKTKHPEALGWKHNHEPGISTKAGKLTGWPGNLGSFPTQAQVNQWEAEWLVFTNDPANTELTVADIARHFQATGVDVAALKRGRPVDAG